MVPTRINVKKIDSITARWEHQKMLLSDAVQQMEGLATVHHSRDSHTVLKTCEQAKREINDGHLFEALQLLRIAAAASKPVSSTSEIWRRLADAAFEMIEMIQ